MSPASGVASNFSSPVIYTVTGADGSTKAYTVTVSVAAIGTTVTYAVDSTTNFPNPARGLYHHQGTQSSAYSSLDARGVPHRESISLILRIWYMPTFATGDLDQTFLDQITADFDQIRKLNHSITIAP